MYQNFAFTCMISDETQLLISQYEDLDMDEKKSFDQFCQQVGLDRECGDKSWTLWESISPQLSNTAKV